MKILILAALYIFIEFMIIKKNLTSHQYLFKLCNNLSIKTLWKSTSPPRAKRQPHLLSTFLLIFYANSSSPALLQIAFQACLPPSLFSLSPFTPTCTRCNDGALGSLTRRIEPIGRKTFRQKRNSRARKIYRASRADTARRGDACDTRTFLHPRFSPSEREGIYM